MIYVRIIYRYITSDKQVLCLIILVCMPEFLWFRERPTHSPLMAMLSYLSDWDQWVSDFSDQSTWLNMTEWLLRFLFYALWNIDTSQIRRISVSDMCSVRHWYGADTYIYIELCHLFKILAGWCISVHIVSGVCIHIHASGAS